MYYSFSQAPTCSLLSRPSSYGVFLHFFHSNLVFFKIIFFWKILKDFSWYIEMSKKSKFWPKNRSFAKGIPKKFGKKNFLERCSCAIFHTDILTRFEYPKCCGATYRTIFHQFGGKNRVFPYLSPYQHISSP